MKEYINTPLFRGIYAIIVFVVTWITADVANVVDKLLVIFSINDVERYKAFVDILVKLLVCIFLTALFIVIYFYVNYRTSHYKQIYDTVDIVKLLKKNRITINEIIVFGYSISFVEPLRHFIYYNSHLFKNLTVRILIPDFEYVKNNLEEDKSITTRLETQNGRIEEWTLLETENRIKKLFLHKYHFIPYEHGIVINDEIMFFHYYKWNYSYKTDKYKLDKVSSDHRKMVKITKTHDQYLFHNKMNLLKTLLKI